MFQPSMVFAFFPLRPLSPDVGLFLFPPPPPILAKQHRTSSTAAAHICWSEANTHHFNPISIVTNPLGPNFFSATTLSLVFAVEIGLGMELSDVPLRLHPIPPSDPAPPKLIDISRDWDGTCVIEANLEPVSQLDWTLFTSRQTALCYRSHGEHRSSVSVLIKLTDDMSRTPFSSSSFRHMSMQFLQLSLIISPRKYMSAAISQF